MTRLNKFPSTNRLCLPPLLWLGGFFLGASSVLAQAPTTPAVPSAQELLAPDAPAEVAPVEVAPPPEVAPAAQPAPPEASKSVDLELSSPGSGQAEAQPSLVSPNLVEQAKSSFGSAGEANSPASNRLIDSTPYSLGATDNPSIVLSERSTGCQAVVKPGQTAPSSLCGSEASNWSTASYGGATGSGDMSLGVVYGGRIVPAGKDFYNLTIRPAAKISSAAINFLFPLSIPAAITSAFGWRIHPVMGESRFHAGTDLGAPEGTPVLAAFAGQVAVADFMGGYGLAVVLRHQNGTEETLYGHMSEIFVKPGETVKQGEVIGRVGSTGLSTGPHLHFEFRKQTPNGWVVMDAGGAIDSALNQFVSALKLGIPYPPQLALIRSASFTKALEMAEAKLDAPVKSEQVKSEQAQVRPAGAEN